MYDHLWYLLSTDFLLELAMYNTGEWHDLRIAGVDLSTEWYQQIMLAGLMGAEMNQ